MPTDNLNHEIPSIVLRLDRERVWRLDVPAFERVCDGFDELAADMKHRDPAKSCEHCLFASFAENPVASLSSLFDDKKDGEEKVLRPNRRMSKILRVWIWAGLTGEDSELTLSAFSKSLSVGSLPKLTSEVFPVLSRSFFVATEAEEGSADAASGP